MISKQLKIEGLADMSKSTVENRWNQAQVEKYLPSKKSRTFEKTEAKLLEQVNQIRIDKQRSERIRDLQFQRAATPEGRQEIFKNSAELLEFAQHTVPEYTLKDFELICNEKGLPIAKTLSDIVGPLEKYEEENEDMCMWPDLPSYIKEKIDTFVEGEQEKKRRHQLQRKLEHIVPNTRCPDCHASTEKMSLSVLTGKLKCTCGCRFEWLCVGCKNPLIFDYETISWFCKKCDVTFTLPTVTFSDFIVNSEPE
jgi:hypothetical protein